MAKTVAVDAGDPNHLSSQTAGLTSALGEVTTKIADRFNAGLATLMTNKTTFVSFVQSGGFSEPILPDEPGNSAEANLFLGTYVVSAALTANGFYAAVTPNSKVSDPAWKSQCTYNGVNICYQDPSTDLTWQLKCKGCKNAVKTASDAFDPAHSWTNAQLLMQGSWNCTADGLSLTGAVALNADGSLNRTCPSHLPQCYSGGAACPVPLVNGACPIAQCK